MRLILLAALTLLAGVVIGGHGALPSCTSDADCPKQMLCCTTQDDDGLFQDRNVSMCAAQCHVQEIPRPKRSIFGLFALSSKRRTGRRTRQGGFLRHFAYSWSDSDHGDGVIGNEGFRSPFWNSFLTNYCLNIKLDDFGSILCPKVEFA